MPDYFTTLKTGRKRNKYLVESEVSIAGRTWGRDESNFALKTFNQR
jgi:hypothetical protein